MGPHAALEHRQSFFLALSDALRPLGDPGAIEREACRLLGDYLGADHTYYVEIRAAEDWASVRFDHARNGTNPLVADYRLSAIPFVLPIYQRGTPVIINDARTSPLIPDANRAIVAQAHLACIAVPVIKDAVLVGSFCVAMESPREWQEDHVAIVAETAERVWAAVDHARAEMALRDTQERFALALDIGELASWDWDLRTNVVTWNERHFLIQGYSVNEVAPSYDAWLARVHPADREATVANVQRAKANRQTFQHEYRTLRPDGSIRWCAARGRFFYEGDEPRRMIGVLGDITDRKLAQASLEKRVRERTAEVQDLFRRLVSAQEEERRRIARDIHDHLGQQMTALRMNLETLRTQAATYPTLVEQADRTQRIAEELDQSIDFLTWQLRPAVLDHLGLSAALRNLVSGWSERFGIPADFDVSGIEEVKLTKDVEANLYRIAQEALHNVAKHAGATQVSVVLTQRDGHLTLVVDDNGRGFDSDAMVQPNGNVGLGLISMRERAALVGGHLDVDSSDSGTSVYVRIANALR